MFVKNLIKRYLGSNSKHFMKLEEDFGCHNYAPLPVVIAKGEGIYMYDCEGNQL